MRKIIKVKAKACIKQHKEIVSSKTKIEKATKYN